MNEIDEEVKNLKATVTKSNSFCKKPNYVPKTTINAKRAFN
jgi:hypothetical protein